MKKITRILKVILSILSIFLLFQTCKKDTDNVKIRKDRISGYVQKGPYINGTTIQLNELNSSLEQTGKVFSTQIIDNKGSFEIANIALSSQFVQFLANGYYFNEFTGDISPSPLSLYALSDITDISTVNVNILTHLEKSRVEYLIVKGKSFSEAKDTAQKNVLAIFGFQAQNMDKSEMLDIAVNKEENAILLAISIILQGNRTVGDLTELLANITTDIQQDGKVNDATILSKLRSTTVLLDLAKIRINLEKRYQNLGINTIISGFEKYVNYFLSFTGLKPTATTQAATSITTSGATLNGTANANDLTTTITFEYGTTTDYGSTITATQSPVSGHTNTSVTAALTGLNLGTLYHFRVKTVNLLGTVYGLDVTFSTLGAAPTATTQAATNITNTSAILNGTVNANNLSTTVTFEYGTTTAYGGTITATQSPVAGNTNTNVTSSITGLQGSSTYHYRVKAVNSLGTTTGNDMTLVTTLTGVTGTVTDIDGNTYQTIGIGYQIWMAENLKTTKYNDGTAIPNIAIDATWAAATTGVYSDYGNTPANSTTYGRLYNWYAVDNNTATKVASNGGKNVCPTGWHVPTDDEWTTLTTYLGGEVVAGGKLKETGLTHWITLNSGATNETGFTALPGGDRLLNGKYEYIGLSGVWWTSTENSAVNAWAWDRNMLFSDTNVHRSATYKQDGFSVRCLKDN
jgi:uncharacterized protein (TIGR02145 family)